jgi:hypothetical protein
MKLIFCLIISFLPFIGLSLDVKSIMAKMRKVYEGSKNIEYSTTYDLMKGHKTNVVHSTYNGYFYKLGDLAYQKIDQTEFVYFKDYFFKINHKEKAAIIEKAQQFEYYNSSIDNVISECSKINIEESEGFTTIIFFIKNTSSIPFSIIRLKLDADKFYIKQLDFYYTNQQDFSTKRNVVDKEKPHLRIKFIKTNFKPSVKKKYFNEQTYFKSPQKKYFELKEEWKNYEFIDNRNIIK